ncbi:hypothetical protein V1264_012964 [Littorina saxatilis]|uniref:Transmembrane protein n=1 Tax=Littorina saxatilis TaxID=31220 RepID=A0AAN9C3F3_9CAEN
MVVLALARQLTRLFYRLTVGLTVLLIKAGIICLASLVTVGTLAAFVAFVTYRTYKDTDNVCLAAGACGLAVTVCGGVVFVLHRLARDVFKLTTLSLGELIMLMFGVRRSKRVNRGDNERLGGADDAARGDPHYDQVVIRRVVVRTTTESEKTTG